ncbi:MAG: phosphoribosylanthranilate isomerase [Thermodesulfobacteriota bacterium]
MNHTIVQIYEIQTPEEAEAMVEAGVDHIGGVLTSETDRQDPQIQKAVDFVRRTPAKSSLIPLFSAPESVFRVIDGYRPDMIHFCEALADSKGIFDICEELIRLQEEVRRRFPEVRIIRSIPICPPGLGDRVDSLGLARLFEGVSDFFLTDTLILSGAEPVRDQQPVSGFVGITGRICDWNLAAELVRISPIPVILAGGISPDNVAEAVLKIQPFGVDSCTATNQADAHGRPIRFRKDVEKVRRFVSETRRADRILAERSSPSLN